MKTRSLPDMSTYIPCAYGPSLHISQYNHAMFCSVSLCKIIILYLFVISYAYKQCFAHMSHGFYKFQCRYDMVAAGDVIITFAPQDTL